nr:uncharacterized mitochondrial protein AtMg00810-like [Tanacetum cinerariifolium]
KVRKATESAQQYVLLPLWSTGSKDPQNIDVDAAFDVKENESEAYVFPSSSDKPKKHNENAKREAKGKSHVEFTAVTAVGPNLTNSTNSFNVAGPSDNVVSPNFEVGEKSSFMNHSQYPDDPDMPTLEDIIYLDDVGADADFSNLETSITVSPIPTTRVHKDHPVTQIIGDLSLAPQTRRVYVCQPLRFEDLGYPDKVYKMVKALYGLHQAPKAWYETLANYLLENGFQRRKIDQSFFIKKQKGDILLVQVYVDDIIFGSTNKKLSKAFEKLMKDKFQMSSMGELTFFVGLQVKQKDNGIFISQAKYVAEILRKFGLIDGKSASTPIDTEKPLLKDPDSEDVDVHIYRSMISSLMYLTLSRPDIMFVVCACAHVQVTLKVSHLHAVKRIFRYLKGKPHLALWYPKDSTFNLVAYSDSNNARASLDRKSTTGCCQFLGCRLISWQCKKQNIVATSSTEAEYVAAASCYNDVVKLQALIDRKKVIITEATIRQNLRLNDADGIDCLANEEIFIELARMRYEKPSTKLTFYKAFFSAQWNFLIHTIVQCMSAKRTAWNEFSSSMAASVICLATETPLFDAMLVPQQVQDNVAEVEEDEDNEVSTALTPPSPTPATTPLSPQQEPIPSPP